MWGTGPLFFPVTPFGVDGGVAHGVLADHIAAGVDAGAGAVFVACGTGEFHALSLSEYAEVVATAVNAAAGRVRVVAGAGGTTAAAVECVRLAEQHGADAILLMPPYLVHPPQGGLVCYTAEVAAAADLPVIVYHRANAVYTADTAAQIARIPRVVGLKDGHGDIELLRDIATAVHRVAQDFALFNGMPTAETTMMTYRELGVSLYSSAVFTFSPTIAMAFYSAIERGDEATCERLLSGFFRPLATLRDRVPGYAVSLIKAGLRLRGVPVGGVRAPLLDPTHNDLAELEQLIKVGTRVALDGLSAKAKQP